MADANDGARPAAAATATRAERMDFLKQMLSFTEGNIRSYDSKAQISVAAFVLSFPSFWMVAGAGCARFGQLAYAPIPLLIYFLTILLFFHVLWPVKPPRGGPEQPAGIFFIREPGQELPAALLLRLAATDLESELAGEVLKLAYIRNVKSRRFKLAMLAALVFFAVATTTVLVTRGCRI